FLLALVRKHGSANAVAYRPHPFGAGAALMVDLDESALVELDTRARREQIARVGPSSDRHEESIHRECLLALAVRVSHLDRASRDTGTGHLGAETDIEPELLEVPSGFLGELLIGGRQEVR